MDMASVSNKDRVRQSFVLPAEGVLGTLPARQVHAVLDAIPAPSSTDKVRRRNWQQQKPRRFRQALTRSAVAGLGMTAPASPVTSSHRRSTSWTLIRTIRHQLQIVTPQDDTAASSDYTYDTVFTLRPPVIEPNDDAGIQALYVPISWK
ncbi:hypothetical protein VCV18_002008 [Metarhizium anisopliae]